MPEVHGGQPPRRGARLSGVLVALVGLLAAVLLVAPPASAEELDAPPVTLEGCTVTVPAVEGVQYRQDAGNDNLLPAGDYEAHEFYGNVTFTAEATSPDDTIAPGTATTEIEIPADCLVEVAATCESVTFTPTATAVEWGTVDIGYGPEAGTVEETVRVEGPITVTPDYDTLHYTIDEIEMQRTATGSVDLVCETTPEPQEQPQDPADPAPQVAAGDAAPDPATAPAPEPAPAAPVPTVAPAAGW